MPRLNALLDEILRQIHLGLLLKGVSSALPMPGENSRLENMRHELDEISSLIVTNDLSDSIPSLIQNFSTMWPPKLLGSEEQVGGFADRLRNCFVREFNEVLRAKGYTNNKNVQIPDLVTSTTMSVVLKKTIKSRPPEEDTPTPVWNAKHEPERLTRYWVSAAQAAQRWKTLHADLSKISYLSGYRNNFRDNAQRAKTWETHLKKAARRFPGASSRRFPRLFDRSKNQDFEGFFEEVAKEFERYAHSFHNAEELLGPIFDQQGQGRLTQLSAAVESCLNPSGPWPPNLLGNFVTHMRTTTNPSFDIWSSIADAAGNELLFDHARRAIAETRITDGEDVPARLVLINAVINVIDANLSGDSEKLSRDLIEFGEQLFRGYVVKAIPICGRSHSSLDDEMEVITDNSLSNPTVERTGLVLAGDDGMRSLVETACIREPTPVPPAVSSLIHLDHWLRLHASPDRELSNLIHAAVEAFNGYADLSDWWRATRSEATRGESESLICDLLRRITMLALCEPQSPGIAVLEDFSSSGFRWETVASGPDEGVPRQMPSWSIVSWPSSASVEPTRPGPATRQPCALRTPDKALIWPRTWLYVPVKWLKNHPLAVFLANCEPLRLRLEEQTAEWPGWRVWNALIVDVLYAGDNPAAEKKLLDLVVEAFTVVYQRSQSSSSSASSFFELAKRLFDCLNDEFHVELVPALDKGTLRPQSLRPSDTETRQIDIQWASSREPTGSVLSVDSFGTGSKRPRVQASFGPDFSQQVGHWVQLPRPQSLEGDLKAADPVDRAMQAIQGLPWLGREAETHLKAILGDLASWLRQEQGENILNDVLNSIRHRPNAPANDGWIAWLTLLQEEKIVELYPHFDFATGAIEWMGSPRQGSSSITWIFHDTIPVGNLIGDQVTFAVMPERAAGTFSLGLEAADSPVAIADQLANLVGSTDHSGLIDSCQELRHTSIQIANEDDIGECVESAAGRCLASLVEASSGASSERLEICDRALQQLRQWCGAFGWSIAPEIWVFSPPVTADEVTADDSRIGGPSFIDGTVAGQLVLDEFGLIDPARKVVRPSKMQRSAGSAPQGYWHLLETLESVDRASYNALANLVRSWPERRLKSEGTLKYAIQDEFFDNFWDVLNKDANGEVEAEQTQDFQNVKACVAELLRSELGLFMFFPERIGDVRDGWIKPVNSSSTMSGRIRRVIRPGLRDDSDSLVAKAVVELD